MLIQKNFRRIRHFAQLKLQGYRGQNEEAPRMANKAFRVPPKCSVVMRIYGIVDALYNKTASETGFLNTNVIGYIVHRLGAYVKRKLAFDCIIQPLQFI